MRANGYFRPLGVLGLLVATVITASCTPLLETGIDKCKKDSDCTSIGKSFANSYCDVGRGLCVAAAEAKPEPTGCESNKQCTEQNDGRLSICRKSDRKCVEIKSNECPDISPDNGDAENEDAVFIGTILPRNNATVGGSIRALEDGMDLARDEIMLDVNGLPPTQAGGHRRPIVMIRCDEENPKDGVNQGAKPAAMHLIDLEVPAIIGAYYSGATLKLATDVTVPNKVLLVSPASNSPAISVNVASDNPRLVWRTVPNDVIQGKVVPGVFSTVIEPRLRQQLGSDTAIRVAIVHRGDTAGRVISAAVTPNLMFNGKTALDNGETFKDLDYGDPAADSKEVSLAKRTEVMQKLLAFRPHLAIAVGATIEVIDDIFKPLEGAWPDDAGRRPYYLLANNTLQHTNTLAFINAYATKDDLRHRVIGHIAGAANTDVTNLRNLYEGKYSRPWAGAIPFAYDAFYLVAMGIVATGNAKLEGQTLATSLTQLLDFSKPPLKVGVGNIQAAFDELSQGGSVNLQGVSGPLDFDEHKGDALSDIQVWCAGADATGKATDYRNSGLYYNATEDKLVGSFDCP